MNHWEIAGRMASEHRADLDREAVRVGLAALVQDGHPSARWRWRSVVAGWLQGLRTRPGSMRQQSAAKHESSAEQVRLTGHGD